MIDWKSIVKEWKLFRGWPNLGGGYPQLSQDCPPVLIGFCEPLIVLGIS